MRYFRIAIENLRIASAKEIGFGILFLVTAGLAVYVPNASSRAPQAVDAIAATDPPVVRLEAAGSSVMSPMATIKEEVSGQNERLRPPSDRTSIALALQKRLQTAQCYDGPATGLWSAATKDAARKFVIAANAQLPVNEPDQVLLALLESNPAMVCSHDQPTEASNAGTLSAPAPVAIKAPAREGMPQTGSQQPAVNSSGARPNQDTSPAIERVWARPEMLVPKTGMVTREVTIDPSPGVDVEPSRPVQAEPRASRPQNVAQRRARPASYKPASLDGVGKSITKGVKSIQRSLASIFN